MINLYQNQNLKWKRFQEDDDFDYPIDYSAALLNANEDGYVDILYRWEPNCYCHFHRHTAEVSSTVLEGELHVIDVDLKLFTANFSYLTLSASSAWDVCEPSN